MSRTVFVNSGRLRFAQAISVGSHTFRADESSENGGRDAGPDPHELLLASLGACASITLQMYAERKEWPIDAVHVQLSYVPMSLESGANTKNGTAGSIEMAISFSGDLSEDQKARFFEIAQRCPIHRILTSAVEIHTKLLVPGSGGSPLDAAFR